MMQRRKLEVIIDDCLYCPNIRIGEAKIKPLCSLTQKELEHDSIGWLPIPGNCPLPKVPEDLKVEDSTHVKLEELHEDLKGAIIIDE